MTDNSDSNPEQSPKFSLDAVQAKKIPIERPRIKLFSELGILMVLILMVVAIGIINPSYISISTLANLGQRASLFGIIALGMVFLLSMGEIDLSVGSMYALTVNATGALIMNGMDPWIAALLGVLLGTALGAFNGLTANILKISVIIVTLGTMSIYRGLTLVITGGTTLWGMPREHPFFSVLGGKPLGIPFVLWVFFFLTIILSIIYRSTRYGFVIRAIGSNRQAARLSGIPIPTIRVVTLMMVGTLAGISGVMTLAFFATGDPTLGGGYELLAIAAAIIGGTPLSGGSGTVFGAFIGAFVIAVIGSGIVQFGVSANWSIFVTGAMIIAAVALDAFIRRRQAKS